MLAKVFLGFLWFKVMEHDMIVALLMTGKVIWAIGLGFVMHGVAQSHTQRKLIPFYVIFMIGLFLEGMGMTIYLGKT